MRRTQALLSVGVAVATAAVGLAAAPIASATDSTRVVAGDENAQALDYWTSDRMAQATPVGGTASPEAVTAAERHLEAGVAPVNLTWPGQEVTKGLMPVPQAGRITGTTWTQGGTVSRTTGKVYFSLPSGDYTCTATSVQAGNKSTVVTAGHCVYQQGSYARNWIFIPGARAGSEPYGRWTPSKFHPSPQWMASGDVNYDYAFVKLAPRNGRYLANVVGALPISFSTPPGQKLTAFGYSGAAPNYGARLMYCQGVPVADSFGGTQAEGLGCDMVLGSSGGPRLTLFSGTSGTVSAVNSFTYSSGPNEPTLWAARFGPEAKTLYDQAAR